MKLKFILYFIISADIANAQSLDITIAKANYKLTHNYDTANPSLNISENYMLLLGKNSSLYKSLDRQIQDSIMYANFKKTKSMSPPSGKRFSDEQIFFNFKQKKIFSATNSIVGKYYVERSYETIAWKILPETKTINNLNCQKQREIFMEETLPFGFVKTYLLKLDRGS